MSEFEEALWLSAENWVDSFPTDLPKHKFSKKHNKRKYAFWLYFYAFGQKPLTK